jgi:hypothetical protein
MVESTCVHLEIVIDFSVVFIETWKHAALFRQIFTVSDELPSLNFFIVACPPYSAGYT